MKRLRTLSIRDPDALYRRNRRQAWGEPYWRNVNARKRLEWERRRMQHARFYRLTPIDAEPALPGEIPLDETASNLVRH